MALIALMTFSLLGCGFMLYVLLHWIRDARRKPSSGSGDEGHAGRKQLRLVHSGTLNRQRNNHPVHPVNLGGELSIVPSRQCPAESSCHCSERVAYQRIAESLIPRKRA